MEHHSYSGKTALSDRRDDIHHREREKKLWGTYLQKRLEEHGNDIPSKIQSGSWAAYQFPFYRRLQITQHTLPAVQEEANVYAKLITCLKIRRSYMESSKQTFSRVVTEFLNFLEDSLDIDTVLVSYAQPKKTAPPAGKRDVLSTPHIKDPWNITLKPNLGYVCSMDKGVVRVADASGIKTNFSYISYEQHVKDLSSLCEILLDGPVRSHSERRLNFLRSKFDVHINLNEVRELADVSSAPYRDFYNVLKVDTHIHAAACMTGKNLLKCISEAARNEPNVEVLPGKNKGDPPITLSQLFEELKLDPEQLSVDSLDCHADHTTMNRFDRFDNLYNVAGESSLRKVFLKPTNNLVRGRYFAELIKEFFLKKESQRYFYSELRISASGLREWKDLANWTKEMEVYSDNNRWVIQVPRCYKEKRQANTVKSFEQFLSETFLPMFLATSDPESYPEIAAFLEYVVAMDSVSDESKVEELSIADLPTPDKWTSDENPPYAYYLYYMYANLTVLNKFREERGMNIFKLRPHAGESGSPVHLASAFLLAENISHGIQLTQSASLEYLYYLAQMPIALSPLSNNALFLPYLKHPLKNFFAEGIPVSLSTDDPLMFHLTSEPLAEEYAVASQVFGLSICDQCEIARNSVLMSSFPDDVKAYWIGQNFQELGIHGNDIGYTNVPDVRVAYRYETLVAELADLYCNKTEEKQ